MLSVAIVTGAVVLIAVLIDAVRDNSDENKKKYIRI